MPRQYAPRVDCVCQRCGKHFSLKPSDVRRGRGTYCSRDCAGLAPAAVARTCEICEAPFTAKPSVLQKGYGRFCSQTCYSVSQRTDPMDVFWEKVLLGDDCWEWQAAKTRGGYGVLRANGRAHKLAWVMRAGPIPDGFLVGHTCDNPPCVRNDEPGIYVVRDIARPRFGHLWLGTNADNLADMADKGRSLFGERATNVKLKEAEVREILALKGVLSSYAVADRYGVTQSCVAHIWTRTTWKHVQI